MFESLIFAQDGTSSGGSGLFGFLLVIAVLGGFFWLFIIRPQRNQIRRRQELSKSLEIGDAIRTGGGIYGVVRRVDDESVVIEVEDGGLLRVARMAVISKDESTTG